MSLSILQILFIVVLGLAGIGFYGLLASRNLIKVIIALQIMIKGVLLALVVAGKMQGQVILGESLAITVIVADTIIAVIGLAMAVQVRRHCGTLDVQNLTSLRR